MATMGTASSLLDKKFYPVKFRLSIIVKFMDMIMQLTAYLRETRVCCPALAKTLTFSLSQMLFGHDWSLKLDDGAASVELCMF